jgi:hypothetical protein
MESWCRKWLYMMSRRYSKTQFPAQPDQRLHERVFDCARGHTCNNLGSLEVLIGMQVAWCQSKPQAHEREDEVGASPHC